MLDVRPVGPGIIEGIVTSDGAIPVPDVKVTAEIIHFGTEKPILPDPSWETITNNNGGFRLCGLPLNPRSQPAIQYLMTARSGRQGAHQCACLFEENKLDLVHLVLTPDASPAGLLAELESELSACEPENDPFGAIVSGRVIDAETDLPLEGVTIQAHRRDDCDEGPRHVTSDALGFYLFDALPQGEYMLFRLDKPGYRIGKGRESKFLLVEPGHILENVDFLVEPGLDVSGRVVDEEGNPIEGVHVHNTTWKDDDQAQSVVSDERGGFTMRGYAPGSIICLDVSDCNYWTRASERIELIDRDRTGLEIVARPGASIVGVVTDENGERLANVYLSVKKLDDENFQYYAHAGEFGEFYFRGLPPGQYILQGAGSKEEVCLEPGEVLGGLILVHTVRTKPELFISGRVMNRLGVLIPDVRVIAFTRPPDGVPESRGESESDENGFFEITGLGEGEHQITSYGGGHAVNIRQGICAGASGIEIVLDRLITVAGNVVDDVSGAPIRDFSIARTECVPKDFNDQQLEYENCCDLCGRYSVWSYPGDVVVIARARGYLPGCIEVLDIDEGVELKGQEIRLRHDPEKDLR